MNCPACNVQLGIAERQGIEIDFCPNCRGVWLDRGELDKIVERANAQASDDDLDDDEPSRHGRRPPGDRAPRAPEGRRREGFLSRLFDFD